MRDYLYAMLVVIGLAAAAPGCSTAKVRVMPGEDGINRVVSKDIERDGAEEAAYEKARDHCEEQGKTMYVVQENKTNYQGSMDEDTRNTVRKASKVAMLLGGPAGVASSNTAVAGAVSGAGMVGYEVTNDRDYEAQFTFRCK